MKIIKTTSCTSRILIHDLFKKQSKVKEDLFHLKSAVKWLCRAQDSTNNDGVSEGYHLFHGWLPSYPETTGYIIETFFDYSIKFNDEKIRKRAIRMADWLKKIQNEDGSIPDSYFKRKMVFDTGQVVFGLVRAYEETKKEEYKNSAVMAGEWLIKIQEKDGTWRKYAVGGIPHTYYARVAWSLLKLHSITGEEKYINACIKNINWAISKQAENGWFNKASFNLKNHNKPFTHTIAYTIRGILEAGLYLNKNKFIESAIKAIANFANIMSKYSYISGTYDSLWKGDKKFSCLTGNAQLAIILFKIYLNTGNEKYLLLGQKINTCLKHRQALKIKCQDVHGAIAGSYPVWGKYIHFTYPNWAAKFFVDTLLLEKQIISGR